MRLRTLSVRAVATILAVSLLSLFAEARFPQPPAEYQARRVKLQAQIDAPVVVFGYTSREDSSEFAVFFQEPNFYYLTGDSEPDAAVLLLPAAAGTQGPARNPVSPSARSETGTMGRP